MKNEGPALEPLLRRIAETPTDFLATPQTRDGQGPVHLPAVISDLFDQYRTPLAEDLSYLVPERSTDSLRQANLFLILCWLLAAPELIAAKPGREDLRNLLEKGPSQLSPKTAVQKYRDDPERREELARFALAQIGLRPKGESQSQAADRLTSLNASERERVIAAARQAEQRARAIREALARKAAQESADKFTRE